MFWIIGTRLLGTNRTKNPFEDSLGWFKYTVDISNNLADELFSFCSGPKMIRDAAFGAKRTHAAICPKSVLALLLRPSFFLRHPSWIALLTLASQALSRASSVNSSAANSFRALGGGLPSGLRSRARMRTGMSWGWQLRSQATWSASSLAGIRPASVRNLSASSFIVSRKWSGNLAKTEQKNFS